jgi:iron complex outermembrane recepter protein
MTAQRKLMAIAIRSAIFAAALPSIALAQDADKTSKDEMTTLDTIKVTARKREESLRDVPLSITAVTAEKIERLGLESINDIAKISPGFSFRSAFGREGDRPVIRGMSNIQGEPNASFFIDGVYVNGSISGFGLDNLERVEVIRGPQSALFGRRTFSGAVNFITKRPSNEPTANVSLTFAQDAEREFSTNVGGALIADLLKFQLNARFYEFGGQWRNGTTGIHDLGGQRTASAGGTLYFTPNESWESTLRVNLTQDEDEHYAIGRIGDPLNLAARGITVNNTTDYLNNVLNCDRPVLTGGTAVGFLAGASPITSTRARGGICGDAPFPSVIGIDTARFEQAGFKPGLERKRVRVSWANDFTTDGGWVLTSISALNRVESLSAVDQDFSSQSLFRFPFSVRGAFETVDFGKSRDFSQEFRLTTPADSRLRGIAGYYYYTEKAGNGFSADMTSFRPATATTAAVLPVRNPTRPGSSVVNNALFGMLEYDVTDAFTITGELRLAQDRIQQSGSSVFSYRPPGTPATVPATVALRNFNLRSNYDNILPRFTAKYDLNETMNVYGLVAKGNKPGGFNSGVQSAQLTDQARAQLIGENLEQFDEEKAWTYEAGFKAGFLDNRVNFSSAIYQINWRNQQLTEARATDRLDGTQFLTSYTSSIGRSRVRGLELETDFALTDEIALRATYSHQNGKIVEYFSQDLADAQACGAVNKVTGCGSGAGKKLPRVPPNQLSLGADWKSSLSNGMGIFASATFSYEASRFTQIENNIESGACKDVGLRGGVNIDEHLSATLFVRNALNDKCVEDVLRYVAPDYGICRPALAGESTSSASCTAGAGLNRTNLRDYAVTPGRLRQAGLTLNYRF